MKDNSALLSWKPLPVQDQHGFLKNYGIWISRIDQNDKGTDNHTIVMNYCYSSFYSSTYFVQFSMSAIF